MSAAVFDRLAATYDDVWTRSAVGKYQREAVWRHLPFQRGDYVLDIGCGTGEDALWLAQKGVEVSAIDVSPEMVRIARSRGVKAAVFSMDDVSGKFDGILSNFGALNCVPLQAWAPLAARLVLPGGYFAICVIGRFCLWESLRFAGRGQFRKAVRRWGGEAAGPGGMRVFYPTCGQIRAALPEFHLVKNIGIGISVPPFRMDARIESIPVLRSMGDHRLLVFQRER